MADWRAPVGTREGRVCSPISTGVHICYFDVPCGDPTRKRVWLQVYGTLDTIFYLKIKMDSSSGLALLTRDLWCFTFAEKGGV